MAIYQAGCRVVAADCVGDLFSFIITALVQASLLPDSRYLTRRMINSPFKEIFPDYQEKLFALRGLFITLSQAAAL